MQNENRIQIKICGLTNIEQALKCAELGANAIGCVFYPKSPRNLSEDQAREICKALPSHIKTVGVFVNETFETIMQRVDHCHLSAVQLHGTESPELISRLRKESLTVIKGLYIEKSPSLEDAPKFDASAFLIECGKGKLPGGNAMAWNWGDAKEFGKKYPFILAGGLTPENVYQAIIESEPDAVDVSSGVEASPGQKDIAKVEAFINEVSKCRKKVLGFKF